MRNFNLIAADFKRLKKDKPMRVVTIINVVLLLLSFALFKAIQLIFQHLGAEALADPGMEAELNEVVSQLGSIFGVLAYLSSFNLGNLGFYVAIAACIFIGKDFSYNTIRNKIISGNSREKIYLSSLCSVLIIGLFFYLLNAVFSTLFALMFFGIFPAQGQILQATLLTLPIYIGIISIMLFVSMTVKAQALGIVFNLLIIIILPTILDILRIIPLESNGIENFLKIIPYSLLSEVLAGSSITVTMDDLTGLQTEPALTTSIIVRSFIVPLAYTAVFTLAGILIFKKADIK